MDNIWPVILTSSLLSTSISLAVTMGRDYFKDRRDRKADAHELARALEKFARDCAAVITQASLATLVVERDNEYTAVSEVGYPAYVQPTIAWKLLPHDLVDRIKAFPDEIVSARDALVFEWEFGGVDDPLDYLALKEKKVAALAQAAWALAVTIRIELKLPFERAADENGPALGILASARERLAERDRRIEENNRKFAHMWDEGETERKAA